ncbi:hepatic lectin-like [Pelodytes ibericus]
MDSDFNISCERLDGSQEYSGRTGSFFEHKRVGFLYGLLGLSYVLIGALFIIVLSRSTTPGTPWTERQSELSNLENYVADLTLKLSKFEKTLEEYGAGCGPEWTKFNGSCYFFSEKKFNWMKARSLCLGMESDLVVIDSQMEQNFLGSKTKDNRYWIGLNDEEDEGVWSWVDGTNYTTSFKFWKKGEPNDHEKNEDCAHMWISGEWNDVHCTYNQCYAICERKHLGPDLDGLPGLRWPELVEV